MSWYTGTDCDYNSDIDEIILHASGKCINSRIYLRIYYFNSKCKLQISASTYIGPTNITFKFKKMI